jgi:rhodanese-related sulfurtransferase
MKKCHLDQRGQIVWFVKTKENMQQQINHYQHKLQFEIDPSDLYEALKNGEDVIVIDARKPQAFDKERIPGSINLPHRAMNERTTEHLRRDALYVTYCDGIGCNASTKGALNMAQLGFNVKELIGGLAWWKLDGFSTEGTNTSTIDNPVECAC